MKTNKYTVRCYDRNTGRSAHDHILCKGVEATSEQGAIDKALSNYNPMVGDAFVAELERESAPLKAGDTVPTSWGSQMAGGYYAGAIKITEHKDGDFIIQAPDGCYVRGDNVSAEKFARDWFKKHTPKGRWSVGKIDWEFAPKHVSGLIGQATA